MIWDIQRVGPSTGIADAHLARRRSFDGVSFARRYQAHHAVSVSVDECFTMASEAFDLAEQLQTPVFVLSDLDLGMNNWMSDPFPYPDKPINRGKVLTQGRSGTAGGFAPLQGCGWRRHWLPHAARD